jgi:hypothetical protein
LCGVTINNFFVPFWVVKFNYIKHLHSWVQPNHWWCEQGF